MSNKGRILTAEYDEESGVTVLTRQNKYGTFTAYAICDEEDQDIKNRWTGYSVCEHKIRIQMLKVQIKELKARLRGMQIMYANVTQSWEWDHSMQIEIAEKMDNQIQALCREINILQKRYDEISDPEAISAWYQEMSNTRRAIRDAEQN